MTRDDERAELARRQAALLAALVAGGDAPPGFDPARLAVETHGLRAKRRRALADLVPHTVAARWGDELDRRLDAWVVDRPVPTGTSVRDDAAAFVASLPRRRRLVRRRAGC